MARTVPSMRSILNAAGQTSMRVPRWMRPLTTALGGAQVLIMREMPDSRTTIITTGPRPVARHRRSATTSAQRQCCVLRVTSVHEGGHLHCLYLQARRRREGRWGGKTSRQSPCDMSTSVICNTGYHYQTAASSASVDGVTH